MGLSVSFTDTTSGIPVYWYWDFGDGYNSEEQNPTHIYNAAGTYDVYLYVIGEGGSESEVTKPVTVSDNTPFTHTFDLTLNDGGFVKNGGFATWVLGQGWTDVTIASMAIKRTFAPTHIDGFLVYFELIASGNLMTTRSGLAKDNSLPTPNNCAYVTGSQLMTPGFYTYGGATFPACTSGLDNAVEIDIGLARSGSRRIYRIDVFGKGADPF